MTPTIRSLVATLAGLLLGALPGAPVTAQHFPPDEDVVPMLRYLVEDGATVGIVLALGDSDGSTRILTYGSGGEGARALGAESVFEIGSITKTFTGVLLADMVMRGEVVCGPMNSTCNRFGSSSLKGNPTSIGGSAEVHPTPLTQHTHH